MSSREIICPECGSKDIVHPGIRGGIGQRYILGKDIEESNIIEYLCNNCRHDFIKSE